MSNVQPIGDSQDLVVTHPDDLPALLAAYSSDVLLARRAGKLGTLTPALVAALIADLLDLDGGAYLPVDTDGDLAANSDTRLVSQKAIRTYVNAAVTGLWDDRGAYNASTNLWPSTGGSGVSGAVLKGDIWVISVAGTLGGIAVGVGDTVRALVDSPGQTAANWAVMEGNIGYMPLNKTANLGDLGSPAVARLNLGVNGRMTFSNADVAVPATARYVAQIGTLSAPRSVQMPAAASVNPGQEIIVQDESGSVTAVNSVAFTATGSDTVAIRAIRQPYARRVLISDGVSRWFEDSGQVRCAVGTYAQLRAATGMSLGDRWFCTNLGVGGSEWIYDGTAWRPVSGWICLARKAGASKASPIAALSGVTSGIFSIPGGSPIVPANLLQPLSQLSISFLVSHTGGLGTYTQNVYMGTSGTTADPLLFNNGSVAANSGFNGFVRNMVSSDGTLLFRTNAAANAAAFDGSILAPALTAGADNLVNFGIGAANAGDAFALLWYQIDVCP